MTPIDLYGQLEKVILHELGHTRSGGDLADLPSSNPNIVYHLGWMYATSVRNPTGNAENHAIFGLGGKVVQLGFSVDPNGGLHQIAASKKARGYQVL